MLAPETIEELNQIAQIEELEDRYLAEFGLPPLNVSHWDPSSEVREELLPVLRFPSGGDLTPYIYSYTTDLQEAVLTKLGFDPREKRCLITPAGTSAMLCATQWLSTREIRSLRVLCPYYFPLTYQSLALGVPLIRRFMLRREGRFYLPDDLLAECRRDEPIWLTNPVYCTGVYLSQKDISSLKAYLDAGGMLVADECLAASGRELGRELGEHRGFVGIYCPHKSICLNAAKFGVVVFDRAHERSFEHSADVLYGGLSVSTLGAVRHFLSENFGTYDAAFQRRIRRSWSYLRTVMSNCEGGELDVDPVGHFVSFYKPTLHAGFGSDIEFLWRMIRTTAASIIPGTRSYFDERLGLSFRINLALDSVQFRATATRLLRFLGAASSSPALW